MDKINLEAHFRRHCLKKYKIHLTRFHLGNLQATKSYEYVYLTLSQQQ